MLSRWTPSDFGRLVPLYLSARTGTGLTAPLISVNNLQWRGLNFCVVIGLLRSDVCCQLWQLTVLSIVCCCIVHNVLGYQGFEGIEVKDTSGRILPGAQGRYIWSYSRTSKSVTSDIQATVSLIVYVVNFVNRGRPSHLIVHKTYCPSLGDDLYADNLTWLPLSNQVLYKDHVYMCSVIIKSTSSRWPLNLRVL